MNLCYIPPGFIIFACILCALFIGKPWTFPQSRTERFIRSMVVGGSTGIIAFNVLLILSMQKSNNDCLNTYISSGINIFTCGLSIFAGIIATIGQYGKFIQKY